MVSALVQTPLCETWKSFGFGLNLPLKRQRVSSLFYTLPLETWMGFGLSLNRPCGTRKGFRFGLKGGLEGGLNFLWNRTWNLFGFQVSSPASLKGFGVWFKPLPPETLRGHPRRKNASLFKTGTVLFFRGAVLLRIIFLHGGDHFCVLDIKFRRKPASGKKLWSIGAQSANRAGSLRQFGPKSGALHIHPWEDAPEEFQERYKPNPKPFQGGAGWNLKPERVSCLI